MKTFDSHRRDFLKLSGRALATGPLVAATGCGVRSDIRAVSDWLSPVDAEEAARAQLGSAEFEMLFGGGSAEGLYQVNRAGLDGFAFRPRVLVDVSRLDLSTSLLGRRFDAPILVGAGTGPMFPGGQIDILRGATEAHTSVMLDGSASDELRGTASEAGRHAMWYQMDISSSEGELAAELDRALGTGAVALSLAKGLRLDAGGERTLVDVVKRAPIPVLCDGVMSAEEARWAVQNGVAGVIVSNRTGPASRGSSVDALPKIRAALGDDIVILLGGGIRSGTDILKALALGANAVLIGRPVQWGLAAAGNAGVRKVLELLESELALSMALCGRPSVEAIGPSLVRRWATATR